MHMHIGLVEFLTFAAYYLILAFALRWLTLKLADHPVGKALAYLHG